MAQQQNRRNNQSQGNNRPQENTQTSFEQQTRWVLGQITTRRMEIEAVLPPDIPFDRFHATISQALMNNPKILKCTGPSIVRACVKSAYDGLRLDGKEATLVDHNVKVAQNPDRWENHAEYFPMVRGLIKKILMGGQVIAMDIDVIHKNDVHSIVKGTNPSIHHEPLLEGPRGPIIAAYSVATLKNGARVAEVMTRDEIEDVRKEAKTQMIWNRWEGEMYKKTVARRHEKRLPSGREFRDMEAVEMFPQFNRDAPALAAPAPRPTRPAALEPPAQTMGYDLGDQLRGAEREEVDRHSDKRADQSVREQRQRQEKDPADGKRTDVPVGPEEQAAWVNETREKIGQACDIGRANDLWVASREVLQSLEADDRKELEQLFTDRMADLAADDDAGAAAASDRNPKAAETTP